MIDMALIRENPDVVRRACELKYKKIDINRIIELDSKKNSLSRDLESLNQEKKQAAKNRDIEAGKKLKEKTSKLEQEIRDISDELIPLLEGLPNIPFEDVPLGKDDTENVVVEKFGNIPEFNFSPKSHWELGIEKLVDVETAGKVSGSRFAYIQWGAARLQFALISYVFDILTNEEIISEIIETAGLKIPKKAFIPVIPPVIIKQEVAQKMGRLHPKEDRYCLPEDDQVFIGSAEHSLGPIHMNEIIEEKNLPIRYIGYSTSFRREAGTYGKDTQGIIRQHQFDKLEMETFSTIDGGQDEQKLLVEIQKYLMQKLELPFQVVHVCTGDMGTPDARQYDIETWIPTQEKYRETHSSDYMTDYQSRRLNIRYRDENNKKHLVHMNDATCFAIGRTMVAILENNQNADGSVNVPEILRNYMGGIDKI